MRYSTLIPVTYWPALGKDRSFVTGYIWVICLLSILGCGTTGKVAQESGNRISDLTLCQEKFRNEKWQEALDCLHQIPDSNRNQAYFDLKGSVLLKSGNPIEAATSFRIAIDLDTTRTNPYLYFKWGESQWRDHQFLTAGTAMKKYLELVDNPKPQTAKEAEYFIRSASIADSLYHIPREYKAVILSDSINSPDEELSMSMTFDRRYMILTRRSGQEDLYESRKINRQWTKAEPLLSLNSPDNEGGAALAGDGSLVVFTACNRPYNTGSCDLYYSMNQDTGWAGPELMAGVNSRYWDSQPTLSSDGRVIIFSSERPGGFGGRDLWLTVQGEDGWIQPINLGPSVNSPGNEENPYLHTDEYTLYFTSDFWPGFGGRDLFMVHRLRGNEWSLPQNLGYPVNSIENEEGIFIESSGQLGYFSSERSGQFDLYSFELDPSIQPRQALLYELVVVDSVTNRPIEGIFVQVFDWTNDHLVRHTTTDTEGFAAFLMSGDRSYGITLSGDKYGFYSFRKKINKEIDQDLRDTVKLSRAGDYNTLILTNVHFATGEARLLEGSEIELDQLAQYLLENPKLKIKLTGYTDNVGLPSDNLTLSKARAEAVKMYLTDHGVEADRIEATGKGESQPVAPNDTADGRQLNRRTEMTIIY